MMFCISIFCLLFVLVLIGVCLVFLVFVVVFFEYFFVVVFFDVFEEGCMLFMFMGLFIFWEFCVEISCDCLLICLVVVLIGLLVWGCSVCWVEVVWIWVRFGKFLKLDLFLMLVRVGKLVEFVRLFVWVKFDDVDRLVVLNKLVICDKLLVVLVKLGMFVKKDFRFDYFWENSLVIYFVSLF